ncbi:MAG: hypothetical protein LBM13_03325 [Candidatus Ancillula sp.]|jgi:DNA polymerase-1|nr:hypothetical protein [Candidatus Ancillula sp.]
MFDIFEDESSDFFVPQKLLLVDGSYSMYRSYFGYDVEHFRRDGDCPTNCIYGIARQIIQLVNTFHPTYWAFVYDLGRANYRMDLMPTYKGGREKTPDELNQQREPVKEMLRLANIPIVEQERLEADDIIATLSKQGREKGWKVKIFSSDKDMFQLVEEDVTIVRPKFHKSGLEVLDAEYIVNRFGLQPRQYPDLAALVGEGADNIPGVPGVGPKTAAKWLQRYDNLDNLLVHADELTGKVGAALREDIEQVKLNRKINNLIRDADLNTSLDKLEIKSPNLSSLNNFFIKNQIPSLVDSFKW